MAQVIPQLPGLLIDDSAGVDTPWAWTTLPEVMAALKLAYLRGARGEALVAAWRQADISPALVAEVDADVARKAAVRADNQAKMKAASEARAAAAKARSACPPGEGAGASPRESASAPQMKIPPKNTPEKEGEPSRGDPRGAASSKAKTPARPNQKSPLATAAAAASTLMKKFGKAILSAGFTAIPNVLLKNQKELKLSHLDMLLIVHLLSFWWEPAGFIWPSKATLAARVNAAECTVQRRIARMEALDLIKRVPRKGRDGGNKTNVYDLGGLVAKLEELALKDAA
jgi:hypothetical protein